MFRHRTQTFRDRRALCCEESQKDIEIRGRLRSTRISIFEPFFCSERLKKPEFRLTLIGKLTLIDTKGNQLKIEFHHDDDAMPRNEAAETEKGNNCRILYVGAGICKSTNVTV